MQRCTTIRHSIRLLVAYSLSFKAGKQVLEKHLLGDDNVAEMLHYFATNYFSPGSWLEFWRHQFNVSIQQVLNSTFHRIKVMSCTSVTQNHKSRRCNENCTMHDFPWHQSASLLVDRWINPS